MVRVPEVFPAVELDDLAADVASSFDSYRHTVADHGTDVAIAEEDLAYAVDAAVRHMRALCPRRQVDVAFERNVLEVAAIIGTTPEEFVRELETLAGEEDR